MSNRLLAEGASVSYDDLNGRLEAGEVLVATWLRDPNLPDVRTNVDEGDVSEITRKTTHGYYVKTRWFASTDPSENYFDYNG